MRYEEKLQLIKKLEDAVAAKTNYKLWREYSADMRIAELYKQLNDISDKGLNYPARRNNNMYYTEDGRTMELKQGVFYWRD